MPPLNSFKSVADRIDNMEKGFNARLLVVEKGFSSMKTEVDEILSIAKTLKTGTTFIAKHGKTIITFGAGLMTAAGVGNPLIWEYILKYFGG